MIQGNEMGGMVGTTVCVAVHVGDVRSGISMSKSGHPCGENAHRYEDSGMNDHPNNLNAPRRALEQDVPQVYPMSRRTAHQARTGPGQNRRLVFRQSISRPQYQPYPSSLV